MAKQPKNSIAIVGFNCEVLDVKIADKVRTAADQIRSRIKKALVDIIEVGKELLGVKEAVTHGQFGPWLKAEFGWTDRTAQNFMSVAERFGPKSEIISDLKIQPTAAYLLAAPSVPDEARDKALQRAEAGESITAAVAKKILAESRKKRRSKQSRSLTSDVLAERLLKRLEGYRDRWDSKEVSQLAQKLREFADTLDGPKSGKKSKKD